MPGEMNDSDWFAQKKLEEGAAMSPEEREAVLAADREREESLAALRAQLEALPQPERVEGVSLGEAAREALDKIREEGRTPIEEVKFSRPTKLWPCACGKFDDLEGGEIREGSGGHMHHQISCAPESELKRMLAVDAVKAANVGHNRYVVTEEVQKVVKEIMNLPNPFVKALKENQLPPNTHNPETGEPIPAGTIGRIEPEDARRFTESLEMSTPDEPGKMFETGGPSAGKELVAKRPGGALEKWADVAMWSAPAHDDPQHPIVHVTVAPDDPLGIMAMINGMYTGKVYSSPSQVSDEERREAWEAFAVSRLSETPGEWLQLSILFENVTRAFTHQLIRTRTATYAQESLRFAFKEDMGTAVKLPPSLAGTAGGQPLGAEDSAVEWMRNVWDEAVKAIEEAYGQLVDMGMAAEDARGLLPTNILTRVHDRVDIKALLGVAGMRLCTQAQFEWREVFAKLVQALREYLPEDHPNRWQYELIAERFRPVCFAANRCPMKAKSDRYCSIRAQVDGFEEQGTPSSEWEDTSRTFIGNIRPIDPEQWLADPTAARVRP